MATILKGAPVVAAMNERNAALCEQLFSRRPMNCAVHTASAEQRTVRRIDNGIHRIRCDVSLFDA